jgi:uncharacterized membrane protein
MLKHMPKKILLAVFFLLFPLQSFGAQILETSVTTRQIRATITVVQSMQTDDQGLNHFVFQAKTEDGDAVTVRTDDSIASGLPIKLKKNQKIFLQEIQGIPPQYFFDDVVRSNRLIWIAVLFVLLALVVGFLRGFFSLVGLIITLGVLFGYIFPSIIQGVDPVVATVVGSIVILAVNMHITHGLRKESFLAFVSTVLGLLCVLFFTYLFSFWTMITGMGSEEAILVIGDIPLSTNTLRLFLAGVILGAVGVLDDVAISQTEIIHELAKADVRLTRKQLFVRAMRVGQHHIASIVNTLVLVYAGAAMPVLILFLNNTIGTSSFLNSEVVTEEIVRTMAGTSALVLTVPISTFLAAIFYQQTPLDTQKKTT